MSHAMRNTCVTQFIKATPARVYAALLDPVALTLWRVPDGMSAVVHHFDAREGGTLRVSLTYDSPDGHGKSSTHTDTYEGRLTKLIPDRCVVEVDTFESADVTMQGAMTSTITLLDVDGGTEVVAVHSDIPPGVELGDNEAGWRMALAKLASLVESRSM